MLEQKSGFGFLIRFSVPIHFARRSEIYDPVTREIDVGYRFKKVPHLSFVRSRTLFDSYRETISDSARFTAEMFCTPAVLNA